MYQDLSPRVGDHHHLLEIKVHILVLESLKLQQQTSSLRHVLKHVELIQFDNYVVIEI
jgi:hypothetical protein